MPETVPVWKDDYRSFGLALGVTPRTVMRWASEGKVRAVKLAPQVVRLEPPAEFVEREGQSVVKDG